MAQTQNNQHFLVIGHNRLSSQSDIPQDINTLCLQFYDDNVYMTFKQEKLAAFLAKLNGDAQYSQCFTFLGFTFSCSIYPNGWRRSQTGKCIMFLECKKCPDNVESVTIICKMSCTQTHTQYQRTNTIKPNISIYCAWPDDSLYLAECREQSKLDFICHVDILNIQYQNLKQYHQNVTLPSTINNIWIINNDTLQIYNQIYAFTFAEGTKIYLDPNLYGNIWRLFFIQPRRIRQPGYQIMVELCKWPKNVTKIIVSCNLKISCSYYPTAKQIYTNKKNTKKSHISLRKQFEFTSIYNRK
eukprot:355360_1